MDPESTATLYERVGGTPTFTVLVERFYAAVATDPVLRPLYPEADLTEAARRLRMFLEQYWGGPQTYAEERGHPRLRMRHVPFHVGPAARDAWVVHMTDALDSLRLDPDDDAELRGYLVGAAMSLQNQAEDA